MIEDQNCIGKIACSNEVDGFIQDIYNALNEGIVSTEELIVGTKRSLNNIEFTYLGEGKYALGDTNIDLGALLQITILAEEFLNENITAIQDIAIAGSDLKEKGLEFTLSIDLSDIALTNLTGPSKEIGKKLNEGFLKDLGRVKASGGVSLKAELSTKGKIKIFVEEGTSVNVGIKKIASIKAAGAQTQGGVEFDATSGEFDLFNSMGFSLIGWDFEHTERLKGGSENELNIVAEVEAGMLSIGIKNKPQPSHLGTTPTDGFGASNRINKSVAAGPHLAMINQAREKAAKARKKKEEKLNELAQKTVSKPLIK